MVHVCYAISDQKGTYTKYAGASLCSLFENTEEWITVHYVHDHTLSEDNRRFLMELVRGYGQQILFYDFEKVYKPRLDKLMESIQWMKTYMKVPGTFFSQAIWYRLMIGDMLKDLDRVIYLDADTIINMDIGQLWREEGGANGLGAVGDTVIQENHYSKLVEKGIYPEERYFNSGVLLIDVPKFGKDKELMEKGATFLKEHQLVDYPDQDILNFFFGRECRLLPEKYNTFVSHEMANKREMVEERIYHYAGQRYAIDSANNFHKLFLKYFTKTPWCNADFLSNLAKNIHRQVRVQLIGYANIISGMRRIAVAAENEKEKISQLLALRESEEFQSLKEFNKRGLRLETNEILMFFLKPEEYETVKKHLLACGCTENVHFVNGNAFLYRDASQDARILRDS